MGLNPDDLWVGGYVDRAWDTLLPIFDALRMDVRGMNVLEFGCNVGASAVVCARLGAQVHGIDVAADWVELARLNAARHGHPEVDLRHVPDTRELPYGDASFDLVICNSVLEYVDAAHLPGVQRAIDRVLEPGGIVLVLSTSSRLWPREVHSGRWGINYTPAWVDRLVGRSFERGLWPWAVRHGFGPGYRNLDGHGRASAYLRSKAVDGRTPASFAAFGVASRLLGVAPGLLAPNIFCVLRKPAVGDKTRG